MSIENLSHKLYISRKKLVISILLLLSIIALFKKSNHKDIQEKAHPSNNLEKSFVNLKNLGFSYSCVPENECIKENIYIKQQLESDLKIFKFIAEAKIAVDIRSEDKTKQITVAISKKPHAENISISQIASLLKFIRSSAPNIPLENIHIVDNNGLQYFPDYELKQYSCAIKELITAISQDISQSGEKFQPFELNILSSEPNRYAAQLVSNNLSNETKSLLKNTIQKQTAIIGSEIQIHNSIELNKKIFPKDILIKASYIAITLLFILIGLSLYYFLQEKTHGKNIHAFKEHIFKTIASTYSQENKASILKLLSYMTKNEQEAILALLPYDAQQIQPAHQTRCQSERKDEA